MWQARSCGQGEVRKVRQGRRHKGTKAVCEAGEAGGEGDSGMKTTIGIDPILYDWITSQAAIHHLTCREVIDRCVRQVRDGGGLSNVSTSSRLMAKRRQHHVYKR